MDLKTIINEEIESLNDKGIRVDEIVWRAGYLEVTSINGGIWFGENQEDVEKFSRTHWNKNKEGEGKRYRIVLNNAKYYKDFWHGYLNDVMKFGYDRNKLMLDLISRGYDGIFIDTDTWNDTGDDNSITSKQYVVFDKKNIHQA